MLDKTVRRENLITVIDTKIEKQNLSQYSLLHHTQANYFDKYCVQTDN